MHCLGVVWGVSIYHAHSSSSSLTSYATTSKRSRSSARAVCCATFYQTTTVPVITSHLPQTHPSLLHDGISHQVYELQCEHVSGSHPCTVSIFWVHSVVWPPISLGKLSLCLGTIFNIHLHFWLVFGANLIKKKLNKCDHHRSYCYQSCLKGGQPTQASNHREKRWGFTYNWEGSKRATDTWVYYQLL